MGMANLLMSLSQQNAQILKKLDEILEILNPSEDNIEELEQQP